jgi:hypothetical protein
MMTDVFSITMMRRGSREFCVRQNEEILSDLEKENFNMKLKIFHLENMTNKTQHIPRKMPPEWAKYLDRDHYELELENRELTAEREVKIEVMRESLTCINKLESVSARKKKVFDDQIMHMLVQQDAVKVSW